MKSVRRIVRLAGVVTLFAAGPALAHPGHGGHTFTTGLLHPLTGLDHVLAMTGVGLLAAKRGGKATLLWPCAFVAAMLAGYGLGVWRQAGPPAEPGVLASMIVLGALAASSIEVPLAAGLGLIMLFGACHGYAHGLEAPRAAGLGFPLGFALSTAALHGLGLGLGALALRLRQPTALRLLGGGVALGGLMLVLAG